MKRYVLAAVAAIAFATATPAFADPDPAKAIWGGGDPKTSAYSGVYVPHLIEVMAGQHMTGYHWGGPSEGTVMNAEKVTDQPTNLAVGQLDILTALKDQPIPGRDGVNYQFSFINKNAGPECLYLVTSDAGYKTLGHVMANAFDLTVVTGGLKSGSYGTWNVLLGIYPELADVQVENVADNGEIINRVKEDSSTFGFFVMRPDPANAIFEAIADAELTLVPVVDFELEGMYEFLNLKVARGFWSGGTYHTTACTSIAVITGDPANPVLTESRDKKRLDETFRRLGTVEPAAFKPNLDTWADMWDSLVAAGKAEVTDIMNASKKALEDLVGVKKGQAG